MTADHCGKKIKKDESFLGIFLYISKYKKTPSAILAIPRT